MLFCLHKDSRGSSAAQITLLFVKGTILDTGASNLQITEEIRYVFDDI